MSFSITVRAAAALSASTMSRLPVNLSDAGSDIGAPISVMIRVSEARAGRRLIGRAGSTDEALCDEPLDTFGMLCAHGQTALQRVGVVWRPDDERLFCGSVGVGCHAFACCEKKRVGWF